MPQRSPASPVAPVAGHADAFGVRLKTWRRHNMMKQSALAQQLGVSQPAIARWEAGQDMPSAAHLARLRALMTATLRDELALERLFIARQAAIRALFDCDGIGLVAASQGFRDIWPGCGELVGVPLGDHLVGAMRGFVDDGPLGCALRDGAVGLVSGISSRNTDLPMDEAVHHRWHVCFRRFGPRLLADMVYEPCPPDLPTGITDIVHIDALGAGTDPAPASKDSLP